MKRICQRCLAFLTTLVLMVAWTLPVFAAGETYQVQYDVTYGQTEARTMLEMVNEFRTGGDAWCWDKTNTEKVQVTGLKPLQYDYALEKVAMQRAAEIAISFSHSRPDSTECWTAYDEVGNFGGKAENIAAGRTSAAATFEQWQETDKDYNGQGHRRNMLSDDMTTFAIGHVVYGGMHFWVQEFSDAPLDTNETQPNDSVTTATVKVDTDQVTQKTANTPDPITLLVGGTAELPLVDVAMTMKETWYTKPQVKAQASWEADGNGVVRVENNKLTALKAGETTLSGMVLGTPVSLRVTVEPVSLATATVTLENTQFTVTGNPIEPAVTVTLNGATLVQNTDYTVSYSDNIEVGKATVTVQGIGNYTGTVQQYFTIVACAHEWDNGVVTKEPTCLEEGVRTYTCSLCQTTRTEPIDALGHDWDEGAVTKAATCTEEGVRTYTCRRCGDTMNEAIPTVPHTPETVLGKEATCTEDGLTDGSRCSVCGATLTEQTVISALGHDFGEWETVESPSCTEGGSEKRVCKRCGYTENQNLNPTGHTWADQPTVDKEATCTEDGSQSIHCIHCEATKDSQVIPALGHDWGEGEVTKAATCTEEGERTYTCSRCQATKTAVIPALDHDWGEGVVTKEATCTEEGERTYICSRCQATKTAVIPALDHDWDDGVVTKAATCTEEGERTYTCSRCQITRTEAIPALGHTPETVLGKAATCTEEGLTDGSKCSVCDVVLEEQTVIPALGHDWGEGVVTKEATCTEDGERTYTCSRCQESKKETIPAMGHSYETIWSSDGTNHWHACEVCGDRKDVAAHSWEWVVDSEPTQNQAGKQHEECTVCGYQGRVETILPANIQDGASDTVYRVKMQQSKPEEAVERAMLEQAEARLPDNAVNKNTVFYDLELQSKTGNNTWEDVDASGLQVTVMLPFPDGTNGADYDFIVTHYMESGAIEQPAVTETENGLQVAFQGLSPVAVTAYQLKDSTAPNTPDEPETPSEPGESDTGSGQTQSGQQNQTSDPSAAATPAPVSTENVALVPAAVQVETTAPQSTIPATGDSLPVALLVVLFAAGACGMIGLTVEGIRRRNG